MTDNYAPTRKEFKALLASIPAKYGEVVAHAAVLDDFDKMIDNTIERAKNQGRAEGWAEGYDASDHEAYYFSTHGLTDNPYEEYLDA